jgi:ABC-type multidrug transport system ATPase subunit
VFTAECEKLMELYERLEELDADKAEMRASRILHGLGFTPAMQRKKLKDFSGGWRMRVTYACDPQLLGRQWLRDNSLRPAPGKKQETLPEN